MQVLMKNCLTGAKEARGLTVIIDVFRAFSVECYLYLQEVEDIYAVSKISKATMLKEKNPSYMTIGERDGVKVKGFDYGNSPKQIMEATNLKGKTVIHTTSAGTKGIIAAKHATEIITGSLVNAKAIVAYIKAKSPEKVTLVAMGYGGVLETREDTVCAEYIRALLLDEPYDLSYIKSSLAHQGGNRFFVEERQEHEPEEDFHLCLDYNRFNYVIRADKVDEGIYRMKRIDI